MVKKKGDPVTQLQNMKKGKLPKEKQLLIEEIDNCDISLQKIKKSRKKIRKGDVFVFTIDGTNYFYGKVIEDSIESGAVDFYKGDILVFFYKINTIGPDIDIKRLVSYDILIAPKIVSSYLWNSGFFYTIGNQEITEEEKQIDYGFWWNDKRSFVDQSGRALTHKPKYYWRFSLSTEFGIAREISKEMIFEEKILRGAKLKLLKPEPVKLSKFEESILPFLWEKEHRKRYSVSLNEFEGLKTVFSDREDNIEGNGYDWEELMKVFVKNMFPDYVKWIKFDTEAGLFYMYCSNEDILRKVIGEFVKELKESCLKDYVMEARFE